ncbi:hypothetical protein G9A89_001498 [Geosiphon pyriformis]|nr:hypothetical protein G9A89_001498 [Geosiphon pyriformis]
MGNLFFTQLVHTKLSVYRFTLDNDYIPQMPSSINGNVTEYMHHQTEFWIMTKCECDSFEVYQCDRLPSFKILGDNPKCNSGQIAPLPHQTKYGPYFGIMFDRCEDDRDIVSREYKLQKTLQPFQNQSKLLLLPSSNIFWKRAGTSKKLIRTRDIRWTLRGNYANKPYCVDPTQLAINEEGISEPTFNKKPKLSKQSLGDIEVDPIYHASLIGYFRGPAITLNEMKKENFQFATVGTERWLVDYQWSKFLTKTVLEKFTSKTIKLMEKQRSEIDSNSKIFINLIGHGVGGVYAQILALWLSKRIPESFSKENYVIYVYTFGSPRAGNFEFAQNINFFFRTFRFTYSNDFAPHFPKITNAGEKYVHSGVEYWIKQEDCECPNDDEYIFYECPGPFSEALIDYGESLVCNLGTDGKSISSHFGPYFGTIIGFCENFLDFKNFAWAKDIFNPFMLE